VRWGFGGFKPTLLGGRDFGGVSTTISSCLFLHDNAY
jgi:hypothetical protein